MNIIAVAKNIPQSPKKIRVVSRRIAGMPVEDALAYLSHLPKKAAQPLYKVIHSAAANAEHNNQLKREQLHIKEINVGQAFIRRKPEFRARGRLNWRRSPSSHIRVVLTNGVDSNA